MQQTIITKKRLVKRQFLNLFSNPTQLLVLSFAVMILAGSLLLSLPIATKSGESTAYLDALFTATSATCVTGLQLFDSYTHWTLFGQAVILVLIQLGGLGLVTLTSFFHIAIGKKMGFKNMLLAAESVGNSNLGDLHVLLNSVIRVTFLAELAGTALLSTVFVPMFGPEGVYISLFLAISSFCNAGFDVLGRIAPFTSLTTFNGNFIVMFTVMTLIILGGLGFVVWRDLLGYPKTHKLMLHTRVVLLMTAILLVAGAGGFLYAEWHNPATLGSMPMGERLTAALFQSVTCRTAGFNSINLAEMTPGGTMLAIFLMFIGAAPGSTGGGIKVTTLAVLLMTVICVSRGREDTVIFHRRVQKNVVYKSLAILMMSMFAVVVVAVFVMSTISPSYGYSDLDCAFETVSAFSTTGLSVGVCQVPQDSTKVLFSLLMFLGRVGPVSFALSMTAAKNSKKEILPEGKIMVG